MDEDDDEDDDNEDSNDDEDEDDDDDEVSSVTSQERNEAIRMEKTGGSEIARPLLRKNKESIE